MTHLTTVGTLHLGPILRLGTIAGEMALLLAVAASDGIGVARLVTLFRNVIRRTAVMAGTRATSFDVRTLLQGQAVSTDTYIVLRT